MSTSFENASQYVYEFIYSLSPVANVDCRSDFEFRVHVDGEYVDIEFTREEFEDFEVALSNSAGTSYFHTIESQIKFRVFVAMGIAGVIPQVSIATELLREKGDWRSQINANVDFSKALCETLIKGLRMLGNSADKLVSTGQPNPDIVKEKQTVDALISYYEDNGHFTTRGVSVESLSYLKAALVCVILEKEKDKGNALVPRLRKSIDREIYALVSEIRKESFRDIKLPELAQDHVSLQGTNDGESASTRGTTMSLFNKFPNENATVEKSDGQTVGPYSMMFAGRTIIVKDEKADIDSSDVVVRRMPSGKDKRYDITEADYYPAMSSIPAHYQLKFQEVGMSKSQSPSQTINIHSPQAVQIGDHNTQQITATVQMLVSRIEESDASSEEKKEAKSRLEKFLSHPLVAAIVGATISLGS